MPKISLSEILYIVHDYPFLPGHFQVVQLLPGLPISLIPVMTDTRFPRDDAETRYYCVGWDYCVILNAYTIFDDCKFPYLHV
jgi:hypothetical protein